MMSQQSWERSGAPCMGSMIDSSIEIRRIILLTRLRAAPKGMTMQQLVRDCKGVPGWNVPGKTPWEVVRLVLQSLVDDDLAAVKDRFALTIRGLEYLKDPLKWRIDQGTIEDEERKLFWGSIYETFDKAYRRLRSKVPTDPTQDI